MHRKAINKVLINMIVKDLQPSTIVEDSGLQDFLKVMDPKYIPPSRRSIMKKHLPDLFEASKQELRDLLATIEHCSITTDLWTSRATMRFLTLSCHFLTSDWELKSVILETVQVDVGHTTDNLASTLLTITDKWNIMSKICCPTTDNANNIVAIVKQNKWKHLPCFAHTINLIVFN